MYNRWNVKFELFSAKLASWGHTCKVEYTGKRGAQKFQSVGETTLLVRISPGEERWDGGGRFPSVLSSEMS